MTALRAAAMTVAMPMPGGAPAEQAHEGEVEDEVHHDGGSEGVQRPFRIAVGPQ